MNMNKNYLFRSVLIILLNCMISLKLHAFAKNFNQMNQQPSGFKTIMNPNRIIPTSSTLKYTYIDLFIDNNEVKLINFSASDIYPDFERPENYEKLIDSEFIGPELQIVFKTKCNKKIKNKLRTYYGLHPKPGHEELVADPLISLPNDIQEMEIYRQDKLIYRKINDHVEPKIKYLTKPEKVLSPYSGEYYFKQDIDNNARISFDRAEVWMSFDKGKTWKSAGTLNRKSGDITYLEKDLISGIKPKYFIRTNRFLSFRTFMFFQGERIPPPAR